MLEVEGKPMKITTFDVSTPGGRVLEWHGRGILQCLQANFQGQHLRDMLRNIEGVEPVGAQGPELMFRLIRDNLGATGPCLIALANKLAP